MSDDPQGQGGTKAPEESLPDPVLEADFESFPASDPPSWTGTSIGHEDRAEKLPLPPKPAKQ